MKPILNPGLSLLMAVALITGCDSNTDFDDVGKYARIYMPQAREYPAEHSLLMVDSVQTITYGAGYGAPGSLGKDIDVHFNVNFSLVDSFNATNGTSYPIMPEGSYEMSQTDAIISAGGVSTVPLKLNITTVGAIQPTIKYLLPVSIESSSAVEINKDLQTTYFVIEGDYVEYGRTGWTINDVDSEQGDPPLPATNILDGNPGTFWHTQYSPERPPLPHHVTIDVGEAKQFHGLRIIGRDGFTRGDPEEIIIEVSDDGENWLNAETFPTTFDTENENIFYLSETREGRYLKVTVTDSFGFDDPPITHFAEVYAF